VPRPHHIRAYLWTFPLRRAEVTGFGDGRSWTRNAPMSFDFFTLVATG
jgi:hypothetical protein